MLARSASKVNGGMIELVRRASGIRPARDCGCGARESSKRPEQRLAACCHLYENTERLQELHGQLPLPVESLTEDPAEVREDLQERGGVRLSEGRLHCALFLSSQIRSRCFIARAVRVCDLRRSAGSPRVPAGKRCPARCVRFVTKKFSVARARESAPASLRKNRRTSVHVGRPRS